MSRRKRSLASILDEESESTSSQLPTSRSSRSAYSFINDKTEAALNQQSSTQPYNKVICNCAKCNGKLVEHHTKACHEIDQYSDNDLEESSFGAGS